MARQAKFTVSLSKTSTEPVTVDYATQDGTATAPSDYTAVSGKLTFAPGESSKTVTVPIRDEIADNPAENFRLVLSAPSGGTIGTAAGTATIPKGGTTESPFLSRFNEIYNQVKNPDNGYFGPQSGEAMRKIPYHSLETLIVEAPDWGHESVSETASFYMKLEAWKTALSGDTAGYAASWDCVEKYFIPSAQGQPWAEYNGRPGASYAPDVTDITHTPAPLVPYGGMGWIDPQGNLHKGVQPGTDPLLDELTAAYGTKNMYLMHWLYDVDGIFGFKNANGGKTMVPINNFQRGPVEDGLATITHPCWDDYKNGGHPEYGWQPIYNRCRPLYNDAVIGPNGTFSSQWNYSVAPDAESRCIQAAWIASTMANGANVSAQNTKAIKMADYMQYAFYDKYFRGPQDDDTGNQQDGCHYLLSWGAGFGGGMPAEDHDTYWGFRIGNSEIHFGYNCVDVAYMCQTGKPYRPNTPSSGGRYATSVSRQLELIRWLQSPEGAIAGGVTSNYRGVYGTPTDGREKVTFYGLYYNYSPSWHNPPSNNWSGYQVWGVERVSHLYTIVAGSTVQADKDLAYNCSVILDRWMNWAYQHFNIDDAGVITMPTGLRWVENAAQAGTATKPNTEGTYEYLPSLKWDSTGDYAAFWSGSNVPNPNLHCAISDIGLDLGVAAGWVQIVIQYCYAKKVQTGGLTGVVPNGTATYQQLLDKAMKFLDSIFNNYRDEKGFGVVEPMASLNRLNDKLWVPPQVGTMKMPDGSNVKNNETTFLSMRKFYKNTEIWPQVESYLNGGPVPSQKYHRFWAQVDVAVSYAMLEKFFPEAAGSA